MSEEVMKQRVSLITRGTGDKDRARAFCEALGWRGVGGSGDEPVFFQPSEMVLALWDRASFAVSPTTPQKSPRETRGWATADYGLIPLPRDAPVRNMMAGLDRHAGARPHRRLYRYRATGSRTDKRVPASPT